MPASPARPTANGQIPPWLNPFGAQTAEGLAYIQAQQIRGLLQRSEGTLRGVKADASAPIYKLPAGPLTMAAGIEYYRDQVSITNDLVRISETTGSGLEGAVGFLWLAQLAGPVSWSSTFP